MGSRSGICVQGCVPKRTADLSGRRALVALRGIEECAADKVRQQCIRVSMANMGFESKRESSDAWLRTIWLGCIC